MKIWVDADACPVVAREILFRAADRTGVQLTLVANQPLNTPASKNINTLQVPGGFDVADNEIVKRLNAGDLVITSDIPLAAEVIGKGGHALSPRGELHTRENIGAKLNMRDFMDTMRSSGVEMGGGPGAYGQRDKQEFANQLDRFLTRHARGTRQRGTGSVVIDAKGGQAHAKGGQAHAEARHSGTGMPEGDRQRRDRRQGGQAHAEARQRSAKRGQAHAIARQSGTGTPKCTPMATPRWDRHTKERQWGTGSRHSAPKWDRQARGGQASQRGEAGQRGWQHSYLPRCKAGDGCPV